jgi:tetratricopeptide (TPR) repeat protein
MRIVESPAALQLVPPPAPPSVQAPVGSGLTETATALVRAERFVSEHRYADAIAALSRVSIPAVSAPGLALRVLLCEAWARMYLGELEAAASILERACALAERPAFSDLDRAHALFRLGCCRLKLARVSNAISLFSTALQLADGAAADDALRARIFDWRSRGYQVQREWEAAQTDAERSLELATAVGDARLEALALMQCSLVAERRSDPLLGRFYAERARERAVASGDRQTEARLLNNLGGLSFLLDQPERAVAFLKESFAIALEIGNLADAAQAVCSLAQVHLRCGAPILAEEQVRHALSILEGRDDYLDERGNAHLVLGRALAEQSREDEALAELAAAEALYATLGSKSHVAAVWMAEAELRGRAREHEAAAALYRKAAESLQDVHF